MLAAIREHPLVKARAPHPRHAIRDIFAAHEQKALELTGEGPLDAVLVHGRRTHGQQIVERDHRSEAAVEKGADIWRRSDVLEGGGDPRLVVGLGQDVPRGRIEAVEERRRQYDKPVGDWQSGAEQSRERRRLAADDPQLVTRIRADDQRALSSDTGMSHE